MRSADLDMIPACGSVIARGIALRGAGVGLIHVGKVAGRSALTRIRATSPLKLLTPRSRGGAVWVCASTYGGGLVAGDNVDLHVRCDEATTTLLSTQASTKIYPAIDGLGSSQRLHLTAGEEALVIVTPDPIVPFAGAIYEQHQRLELSGSSTLVLIDWLTSGRRAFGERWVFSRYRSRTDISVDGNAVLRDAMLLDAGHGEIGSRERMGRCDCFATVVMVGPRAEGATEALLAWIGEQSIVRGEPLVFAGSAIPGGAVVRIAGESTETVGSWIREKLAFVCEWLGEDPWSRKW